MTNASLAPIMQFTGETRFLSNFWQLEGGQTVEHLFQAAKTLDAEERRTVLAAKSPGEAKKLGRTVTLRPDWEFVKVACMAELVAWKFANSTELANRLRATGSRPLFEGNEWGDTFWGVDIATGKGQNQLGAILMAVRGTLLFRP